MLYFRVILILEEFPLKLYDKISYFEINILRLLGYRLQEGDDLIINSNQLIEVQIFDKMYLNFIQFDLSKHLREKSIKKDSKYILADDLNAQLLELIAHGVALKQNKGENLRLLNQPLDNIAVFVDNIFFIVLGKA